MCPPRPGVLRSVIDEARTDLARRLDVPRTDLAGTERERLETRSNRLTQLYGWGELEADDDRRRMTETRAMLAELPDPDKLVAFDRNRTVMVTMAENIEQATRPQLQESAILPRVLVGLFLKVWEIDGAAPTWEQVLSQARAAESAGFDLVVLPDLITNGEGSGVWESMTLLGALAAQTTTIRLAHSVVNPPLRSTAVVARAAQTLDEISGGRYTLGIGAGNTGFDYPKYAIPADPRYSRFAEYLPVVCDLLREGKVDREGEYYPAKTDRFEPSGPTTVRINVAAGGPKMLRLAARYGDEWNWWGGAVGHPDHLDDTVPELERACEEVGRDPATLVRTLDVYALDPLGLWKDRPDHVLAGSADEIAESLLSYRSFGIEEVRVDVAGSWQRWVEPIEAMAPVVDALHSG